MGLRIERHHILAARRAELGLERGVILARCRRDAAQLHDPWADAKRLARLRNREPLARKRSVRRHAGERDGNAEMGNGHTPGGKRRAQRIAADEREDARRREERGNGEAEARQNVNAGSENDGNRQRAGSEQSGQFEPAEHRPPLAPPAEQRADPDQHRKYQCQRSRNRVEVRCADR